MPGAYRDSFIEVECVCGEMLVAPASGSARRVACPSCHTEVTVDAIIDGPGIDIDASRATTVCPSCDAPLSRPHFDAAETLLQCNFCGLRVDLDGPALPDRSGRVEDEREHDDALDEGAVPRPLESWDFDGRRFRTLDALARHLRGKYPAPVVEQMVAALKKS